MLLVFNKNNKDIFDAIRDGSKKIETRAATVKYKNLEEGEAISFSCAGESFEKKIAKVTYFASIAALLRIYKPEDIHPDLRTKEEIVKMYHSFPGYKEKIEKSGLVAIEFK
jgi:ASC-1-like (ASCH) protein